MRLRECLLISAAVTVFVISLAAFGADAPGASWPFPGVSTQAAAELSDGWRFAWDESDKGMGEGWHAAGFNRESWKPVIVPGVWDMPPGKIVMKTPQGVGWFARKTRLPNGWSGEPSLALLGAMYAADVWLDGEWRLGACPLLPLLPVASVDAIALKSYGVSVICYASSDNFSAH